MDKIKYTESQLIKKQFPDFKVGDTIKILSKIPESPDKFRLHPFEGVVIARQGSGAGRSFTLRKVSYGEGIERVFPLNSPSIESIEVVRPGKVKRAKLYYLREKVGKHATKIKGDEV